MTKEDNAAGLVGRAKLKKALAYAYLIFGLIVITVEMVIVDTWYKSEYLRAAAILYFFYVVLSHTIIKYVIRQKTLLIFDILLLASILTIKWLDIVF